jgi:hypothetical protein
MVALMSARRIAFLVPWLLLGACTTNTETPNGSCQLDDAITASCNSTSADGGAPPTLGLTGYTCTGSARPDLAANYAGGVPQGTICANQIPPGDGGAPVSPQTYCCTQPDTTCAYNPTADCDPTTYGYECQNVNRPESYNPKIQCGQGVRGNELVDYCCTGTPAPMSATSCREQDGLAGCVAGLVGWVCPLNLLPKGQDLMSNKSRADQYFLLCSMPQLAPVGKLNDFCCYPPAQIPPGGTCTEDVQVSNCNPLTQFGFACYGDDTPADDYPPIVCPNSGTPGTSMEGYPAMLYCCNFINGVDAGTK